MKDTQSSDATSLKERFSSWPSSHSGLFHGSKAAVTDDHHHEPYSRPPAPSAFKVSEILSSFRPDPLLLVTPEKSLGQALLDRNNSSVSAVLAGNYGLPTAATTRPAGNGGGDSRRGRPRVHFAPGTVTSPPSTKTASGGSGSEGGDDDDCVPRSFSAVSQKLYRPGLYSDDNGYDNDVDDDTSTKAPSSFVPPGAGGAPKRYVVETRGKNTVYVPLDSAVKDVSHLHSGPPQSKRKPAATRVIRHVPPSKDDGQDRGASDTEVKEALRGASAAGRKSPKTLSRSSSASPTRTNHRSSSSRPSSPKSPSSSRPSTPSRSPSRLTPTPDWEGGPEVVSFVEEPEPAVRVVREAPLRPRLDDYVFPFHDQEDRARPYDSSKEHPLARPEFNSTTKISQELKSAKAKRPDTWGAVSQTLQTSERKRTQIQEKASARVNVQLQSGLYGGLVDVDVPLTDLCHHLERGITMRAPASSAPPPKVLVGREPDLMEFFSPDLQPELPDLTLTGIPPFTGSLSTADPTLAFDLYRHNRSWEGLMDS